MGDEEKKKDHESDIRYSLVAEQKRERDEGPAFIISSTTRTPYTTLAAAQAQR